MLHPGLGATSANGCDNDNAQWPQDNFTSGANGTRLESVHALTIKEFIIADTAVDPGYVEATLPQGGVRITLADTECENRFLDLHPLYNKKLGGWMLKAKHEITYTVAALDDDGKFVLVPARFGGHGETPLYFHSVSLTHAEKLKAAKAVADRAAQATLATIAWQK